MFVSLACVTWQHVLGAPLGSGCEMLCKPSQLLHLLSLIYSPSVIPA